MENDFSLEFDPTALDELLDGYTPKADGTLLGSEAEQLHETFDWNHLELPLPDQQPQPQPQQDHLAAANAVGMGEPPLMPPFQQLLPPAAMDYGVLPYEQVAPPPPVPAEPPMAPLPRPSPASPDASSATDASSSSARTPTPRAGRAKAPNEENGRSKAQNRGALQGWGPALRVHRRRCGVQTKEWVHDRECKIQVHSHYENFSSESATRIGDDGEKFRCPREWEHLYAPTTTNQRKPDWLKRGAQRGNTEQANEH
ncbi:hypothetical protein EJ03DRAFT_115665 [Teratosphaeria nubilosa]|uniref:Uncharacterized protein n=1 Tax=Teratosphaeria nubilosa TaxID=161662 RepID=A0A6G1L6S8_9PEZI|nr:hypothetical protein EJ03DRAFT_115665 [Teratosphaeria nubilosa]